MKTIVNITYVAFALFALTCFSAVVATSSYAAGPLKTSTPKPQQSNEPRLELRVAAGIVQQAIAKYQSTGSGPKLDSAELTFKVTSGASVGGGVTFWIITIGATVTGTEVQQVGFTYKVPKPSVSPSPVANPSATMPSASTTSPGFSMLNADVARQEAQRFAEMNITSLVESSPNSLAKQLTSPGHSPPEVDQFSQKLVKAIQDAAIAANKVPKMRIAEFQSFTVEIDYTVKYEGTASGTIPVLTVLSIGPKGTINREFAHTIKLTFSK